MYVTIALRKQSSTPRFYWVEVLVFFFSEQSNVLIGLNTTCDFLRVQLLRCEPLVRQFLSTQVVSTKIHKCPNAR